MNDRPTASVPGSSATVSKSPDRSHRRGAGNLVLLWCLWLLLCWLTAMASAASTRWMILGSTVGLMVMWPAFRLSQGGAFPSRGSRVLYDWVALMLVWQAVLWPLRVTAGWSFALTGWLDGAMACWSLLTASILLVGCRVRGGAGRTAALGACVGLLLAEPVLMWAVEGVWTMRLSPIEALWRMTGPEPSVPRWQIVSVGLAGLLAWLAASAFGAVRRGGGSDAAEGWPAA